MSEVTTLLLLRHGEVASHRGDVPVTAAGLEHARQVGKALAAEHREPIALFHGGTRRTRDTAAALAEGIGSHRIHGPEDAFALRNPDMYVAGTRVNMVSSAASLAEQVPGMTEQQAAGHPWFAEFFTSPDRIGWWLRHPGPPGDDAAALAARLGHFARSLADAGPTRGRIVVGVTHSPVLRAVTLQATGADPGEPAYVSGLRIRVDGTGEQQVELHDPAR
ncbi:histidine phosphatase family protein [Amycolatopsis sp. Hca4]|uniref:histidine phosphatase family protein n=1 Tax=Amycolatopsis sp. Hca4 TaxID=2742131 RepID=UPI0015908089|nr:histidine phosphatase family protein [Amycolatopsis sp. Hca4]QKV75804.1 histidine phosphatase family protein [Amycolatopsis sp. Hca4]